MLVDIDFLQNNISTHSHANCDNINSKLDIVCYVTMFIKKDRGSPRFTGLHRKYQEMYQYLEIFTVNLFLMIFF